MVYIQAGKLRNIPLETADISGSVSVNSMKSQQVMGIVGYLCKNIRRFRWVFCSYGF